MRYPLDCAATMFLLGRAEKRRFNIRLSATFREEIEREALRVALKRTAQQYPLFFVRFHVGWSRMYCEPVSSLPEIETMQRSEMLRLPEQHECEARVECEGNRLTLTYFHGVTDGSGGLTVFVHLITEYLAQKSGDMRALCGLPAIPISEQAEDGYRRLGRGFRLEARRDVPCRIVGTPTDGETITSYLLSVEAVKRCAGAQQASVSEWLSAIFCIAVADLRQAFPERVAPGKVRLTVPVDLRRRFPCRTLHNFTLNVYPEFDPEQGGRALPILCTKLRR